MYTYMKAYRLVYFHITFKFQENKYKKIIMYKHFTKHQKTIAQDITTYISSYVCKISFLCQNNKKDYNQLQVTFWSIQKYLVSMVK